MHLLFQESHLNSFMKSESDWIRGTEAWRQVIFSPGKAAKSISFKVKVEMKHLD